MTENIVKSKNLIQRKIQLHTFDMVNLELEKLQLASTILISAEWDLAHTIDHCARSIEYAMLGFLR